MSIGELGAFISTHLAKHEVDVVLSGGSCVSIYTKNKYVPSHFDFIDNGFTKRKKVRDALSEIGFYEENRYFKHPETNFFIEFAPGPLSFGDEHVRKRPY